MPRKKRNKDSKTKLSTFLEDLIKKKGMSLKEIAGIAECSPSTVHARLTGSTPCEGIVGLNRLCEHFGTPHRISWGFFLNYFIRKVTLRERFMAFPVVIYAFLIPRGAVLQTSAVFMTFYLSAHNGGHG